jgi:hypothetical protein
MSGKRNLVEFLAKDVDRDKVAQERREMVISHVQSALPAFEQAVRDLAEGDSIVCRWSYFIQEKDAYMPAMADNYAGDVVGWVLGPLARPDLR